MRKSTASLPIFSSDIVLSSLRRLPMHSLRFIFSKWYVFGVPSIILALSLSPFFRLHNHEVSRYAVYNLKLLLKYNICTPVLIENRLIVTV